MIYLSSFPIIKIFNSHSRYTGIDLFVKDLQPPFEAGDRELESHHSDTLKPCFLRRNMAQKELKAIAIYAK